MLTPLTTCLLLVVKFEERRQWAQRYPERCSITLSPDANIQLPSDYTVKQPSTLSEDPTTYSSLPGLRVLRLPVSSLSATTHQDHLLARIFHSRRWLLHIIRPPTTIVTALERRSKSTFHSCVEVPDKFPSSIVMACSLG